ncbi:MAG TPA: hypothetical protein VIS99_07975, partial [Terrimicrobiaceae bacterium]
MNRTFFCFIASRGDEGILPARALLGSQSRRRDAGNCGAVISRLLPPPVATRPGILHGLHEEPIVAPSRICRNRKVFLFCLLPLDGQGRRAPILHAQLSKDFVEMILHRVRADAQDGAYLIVRFALAYPLGNLLL